MPQAAAGSRGGTAPQPTAAPAPAPAAGPIDLAALGITPPQLTEITDDMPPDDKRKARIG